jgi:hypothetical protein
MFTSCLVAVDGKAQQPIPFTGEFDSVKAAGYWMVTSWQHYNPADDEVDVDCQDAER